MWFLDKAAVPASYRQSDARLRGKRWDLTSATDVPRDVCVAVTSSSVSPPYVHPLGMSYFSSRETRVPGKGFLLHNGPFGEHREENHSRHHRGRVGRFPPMPSSSVRNVQKDYNYRAHRSGSVHKMSDHAWNEVPLLAESYAENGTPLQTYGISAGFDPLADHDENPYAQDDSFHTDEVHASGIDEMNGENYMFCDSQNRRLLSYYKSLEDGEIRPPKRFPMPQRINGKDYNPMLPVETHFTHPNPPFLPAAFSPQFFTDSQDVTQEDPLLPSNAPVKRRESIPLNPVVPSRRSRLVSTGTIPSQLRPKLPNSFCHSRARNRGVLKKSSSTQSTRTLISGIPSPTHSFGSFSSELPPSAQPQGFISSQDNPEHPLTPTTPISHGDTVPDSPHTARLLGQEGLADDSPLWLTSDDDTKHSRRSPLASQLSDLTSWGLSDSSRRVKDVQQGQLEAQVSSGSPSSSADGWTNMRQASHVHRLPRFQVRCGMNRLLAQHATATDVKTRGEDCFTMEAHQQQDSLWAKEPPHTQI
ncbi:uncharacterized protein LOC143293148 [Babylonia areolata]|uniref:uncharacterized protein LOC143293148 n=1 Tax=Babylonia areolata TaxID=304850 RepID=UPI003FD6147D